MNISKNKRNHLPYEGITEEDLRDPEFRREYERLKPKFEMIESLIEARLIHNFTQEDLAEFIDSKQPVISRLESGKSNPTVGFLRKVADALNADLRIEFIPRQTASH